MWKEAAMVMVSCVLFVGMGLSDEIQRRLRFRSKILSCPKCLTMWPCLGLLLLRGYAPVPSVFVSFLFSYAALWLTLILDALTLLYNKVYEIITETDGASEDAATDNGETGGETDDEVPQM